MAEDGMSIVPYGSNLDVVLRHNDSVVCFDRDSQELVLRNAAHGNNGLELADPDCPYCHRPMREDQPGQSNHRASPGGQPEFVNPDYFRMLHNSLPNSVNSSSSSPPRRRLYQPALPGVPTDPNYSGRTSQSQGISSGAFTQGYFKKFFVEETILGRGGKGVVLLVKHMLDGVSLGYYACKRVPVGDDHEWLEKVLGEVQLLQHLSHQNLVSYRHVWLEDAKMSTFGPSVPCAFILQQYCDGGDLHNYICGSVQTSSTTQQLKEQIRRKSKGEHDGSAGLAGPRKLQFDEIYSFFKDITSGIRFLHVNGYIHRDLKPNNCLLTQTTDGLRVLVSDFGEVQSQDAMRRSTGTTGTISYCAPEVLRREYPDGPFGNFTFKSDIFSLGMILYFLCFAELPYTNADIINEELEDLDQLREEISGWTGFGGAQRMRPDLPDRLYTFLERLLSVDPNRRPTADEVLSGIQAGDNFRYRRGTPAGPDTNSNSRVQPIDSSSDIPYPRSPRSHKKSLSRSNPLTLRPSTPYDPHDFDSSPVPMAENIRPERRIEFSPERNLIVRPRYQSPTPSGSPTRNRHDFHHQEAPANVEPAPSMEPVPQTPQLLPPPNRTVLSPLIERLGLQVDWQFPLPFLQLSFFILKLVSAFQPCMPLAVNPWVFYPLLALAAVGLRSRSMLLQMIILGVHLLVVGFSTRLRVLCVWHHPGEGIFGD